MLFVFALLVRLAVPVLLGVSFTLGTLDSICDDEFPMLRSTYSKSSRNLVVFSADSTF